MSEKKVAANRRNALKSTGPKTAAGKARSSKNSLKHGVLSAAPILPGLESREVWEKHRDGILQSLAPVGYLEKLLGIRLAFVSWRLSRVIRYEAEVAAASIATSELDLDERSEFGSGKPSDPAEARAKAETAALLIRTFEALPKMSDEKGLKADSCVAALWALYEEIPEDARGISVPGIPDDDAEFGAFDDWTAGLLRKAVEACAAAARMAPEAMLHKCIQSAYEKRNKAENEEHSLVEQGKDWKLRLDRESRGRMLLDPGILDKVSRYESNLERSFFRTLHEIQRLQASRSGAVVSPPATVDVDLTLHRDGS